MPFAIVTHQQTLFDKYQATVTAFDNVQEDSTWLQGFADALREVANDNWDNQMVTNWTYDNIKVAFVEGDHITYSVVVEFTLGNLQGNQIGQGVSAGSCLLVSTSYIGARPNRGRMYFSGLDETSVADGQWDSNSRFVLRELVEDWSAGIQVLGQTASLQIARRPSSVFPTYVFNPVQLVSTQLYTRSQRRRNGGQ